ncbi:MAG: M20/M25/M40 family metallo-hydrolase [Clostridia bacterium]|nr:M20/M25/M40 family metallo-hydrolase [Clostridia bacterium]
MSNADLFINETDYPDLPVADAVEHLRQALRCKTVSYTDTAKTDYSEFDRLHDVLKRAYPRIVSAATWETTGYSLLITLPGSDEGLKPAVFMAHQDVVPVKPGTFQNWRHEPFNGDLAEGYIWGRGAMDIKQMLIAHLEAAEYLLSRGKTPARSIIFAFAEDEETLSCGARRISDILKNRGIEAEYVLDEGAGEVTDAADYGAPGALVCPIGIYEKGYGDLRIGVRSRGGHSSDPFGGTSLGTLARAIAAIVENPPPPKLNAALKDALKLLTPYISEEPLRTWVNDTDLYENELLDYFMTKRSLYHQVSTTIAPTVINGGSPAANVLPQDMYAVINLRFAPQDTPESVLAHIKKLIPPECELNWDQQIGASRPSETDSLGFKTLRMVLEHYFDRLIFIPAQNKGATDCRSYEQISRCCLRFGPFLEEEEISAEGVHGTNERISVRAFAQGIRVITELMETTCMEESLHA